MKYLPQWWPVVPGVLVLLFLGLFAGNQMKDTWSLATEAPQVSKIATTTITPATVTVYEAKAKAKLPLPRQVQADPQQHVLAASRVAYSLRPQTVATVIKEATGVSETYVLAEPYPWLGRNPSGSLSLSYGLRSGTPVGRVTLTQDLFQIKAANFGGVAHLDSDGAYFVGAGVNYRW